MKKLIALLLALVMVLSLVACTAKEEPEQEEEKPADSEQKPAEKEDKKDEEEPEQREEPEQPEETDPELGTLPLTEEDVTLTIGLMQDSKTENYETNAYTLWLEEQTGVNLEFVYFSSDKTEAVTQLNMMVAGGQELPDILWKMTGVDAALRNELGEDGYLLDLKDYFSTDAYWFWNVYNMFSETDQNLVFSQGLNSSNGALYAFPSKGETGVDASVALALINSEWLDAVGAEKPTNVDELYEVLKLFATEDPNGNGVVDELPLVGMDSGYRTQIVDYIINAFVYVNASGILNATDGKIWTPYTTDEYREALKYLNKLYTEGLLAPAYYTMQESAELVALVSPADEVAISGVVAAHPLLHFEKESELLYDYEALAPLEAETDLGGYASIRPSNAGYTTFITADCEDPALAFRFLDFQMCNQESFLRARYGVLGEDWEWADENGQSYLGTKAGAKVLNSAAYSEQGNQCWHVQTSVSVQSLFSAQWDDDGTWGSQQYKVLGDIYRNFHSVEEPSEVVGTLVLSEEENETYAGINTPLIDYIGEAKALFISGVMDPNNDSDWNTYLDNLKAQGLDQLLEIAQSAYSRMTAE